MVALVVFYGSYVLAGIAGDDAFRCVSFSFCLAQMLGIMVGMDLKNSSQRHSFGFFWEIISGKCFVFSAMLGSTVDTIFAAVYGAPLVPGRHLFGAGCC